MAKRTYTLGDSIPTRFETAVHSGGRSAVVNTFVEDYLRTKEREALHRQITEGCHEMADETRLIEAGFLKADEALHRAIEY